MEERGWEGQKRWSERGREGEGKGSPRYPTHYKCDPVPAIREYCLFLQNRKERTKKVNIPLLDAL